MKKIVILRCLKSEENCAGTACLYALYDRGFQFARYEGEEVRLIGFLSCNGCGRLTLGAGEGLAEKVDRLLRLQPDAIHVGICCKTRNKTGKYCVEALKVLKIFQENGVNIVFGTHTIE